MFINKKQLLGIAGICLLSFVTGCSKEPPTTHETSTSATNYVPQYGKAVVGKPAKTFMLAGIDGNPVDFEQYKGKVVLVNFWATWCPPCRKEIPGFIDVYESHKDKGFVVIGVAIDQKDLVTEFANELNITYPIAYGSDDATQVAQDFGNTIGALPFNVIVDQEQVIRYAEPGEVSKKKLLGLIEGYL